MSSMSPPEFPNQPQKKKVSPLVWILGIIAVLVLLVGGAAIIGTYFVVQKVKQAGLDPELMSKNPGLAMAKIMTTANPDLDLVSVDEGKGLITIREKSTGKTTTVSFDEAKQGKITFTDDKNQKVTMNTDSATGTMEVKTADGSFQLGGGTGKIPAWVPSYPGSNPQSSYSAQSKDGDTASVHFTTKDPVDKVVKFYEGALKGAGLKVTSNIMQQDGKVAGGMLAAEDEAKSKTVMVSLGSSDEGTSVNVAYTSKK